MNLNEKAELFGSTLDQDDFKAFESLLAQNCSYFINDTILTGPSEIASLYQTNMTAGRKKFDVLEWGKSEVESISEREFIIHFSDYLEHNGQSITYRCCQKIMFDRDDLICKIIHMEKEGEPEKLAKFKKDVGLG